MTKTNHKSIMKTTIFTVLFLFSSTLIFSQIKAYTEFEEEVLLYEDGTWEYIYTLPIAIDVVKMDVPTFSGKFTDKPTAKVPKIKQLTASENQITDDAEWFLKNELSLDTYQVPNSFRMIKGDVPKGTPLLYNGEMLVNAFYDDAYNYFIYGTDFSEGRYLLISDKEMQGAVYLFDFQKYVYSPEFVALDKQFISQRINWARIENGILYVSHSHNTYAASSKGMNAYITAINLEDNSIIWRSQPLVSNAQNFIIYNDVIVCGYGFTNEKDYLYTLDKNTGKVNAKLLLKSGPSYLVLKENTFYVRTYNTDYTFKIE